MSYPHKTLPYGGTSLLKALRCYNKETVFLLFHRLLSYDIPVLGRAYANLRKGVLVLGKLKERFT